MTERDGAGEPLELLFAYGTLGPGSSRGDLEHVWRPDAVRGRLFDLGRYPALVDWDDPEAGWVVGHVRDVSRVELEDELDPYEGVEEGLFQRIELRTRAGRAAWVYAYPHAPPATARGPFDRWPEAAR